LLLWLLNSGAVASIVSTTLPTKIVRQYALTSANDFPQRTNCDALVIFPGLDEVQGDISSFFNAKIVFLDVGGLSRKLEEKNKDGLFPIVQGNWNSIDEFRGKVDILKVSHEDLENIRFEGINTTEGKIQNANRKRQKQEYRIYSRY